MAKFFKRVGTKSFKFQFEAYVEKVHLAVGFQCEISVILKRGNHKAQTARQDIDTSKGYALFMEPLDIPVTLYFDAKTKKYQQKKCSLTVIIHTDRGNKIAGTGEIDLASYPNNNKTAVNENLSLKSMDPSAKISMGIKMTLLGEAKNNESIMSEERNSRIEDSVMTEHYQDAKYSPHKISEQNVQEEREENFDRDEPQAQPQYSAREEGKSGRDDPRSKQSELVSKRSDSGYKNEERSLSKRGDDSLDRSHENQADAVSSTSHNNIVEEVKAVSIELDDIDDVVDVIPSDDRKYSEQKFEVITAKEEAIQNRQDILPKKAATDSRDVRSPASNIQFSRKPTNASPAGARNKAPFVVNMQEMEKNLKTVNIFKKNLKDSEKRPESTEPQSVGHGNQRIQSNLSSVNNFTLNPSKVVLQEQPESNQASSRTNRSETNNSTASQISNPVSAAYQERPDRSNQQNIAPENDVRSGKYQFELEKNQLLDKLERGEMQYKQIKQENEALKEDVYQREIEINRLNAMLQAARSQANSKKGGSDYDSEQLKQTIDELHAQNSALVKENDELNSRIDELKSVMHNNGNENARKLRDMQIELERQKDSAGDAQFEIVTLREQNNVLGDRCAKLEHDLRNFKTSYQTLSQENALNLERYNELKEQREQNKASEQENGMEIQKYEKEIERLKGELAVSNQQYETIRVRGNELAKRASEMQTRLTAEKQELENDKLQNEVESKKGTQDTNKEFEGTLNELRKENAHFRAKCNALEMKLKEVDERSQTSEGNYKKELLMLSEKYHQLKSEHEKLRGENQSKTNNVSSELAQHKEQILTLKKENEKELLILQQEIEKRDAKAASLEKENRDLTQKLVQVQREMPVESKNKGDQADLVAKITVLEQRLGALQASHDAEKRDLEQKLIVVSNEQKEHAIASEKTIGNLKRQLKDAEGRKEEAFSKQTELSIQIQTLKINNDRLQTEIESKKDTLQGTARELEDNLNELRKENAELHTKCNAFETELKETEEKHQMSEENYKKQLIISEKAVSDFKRQLKDAEAKKEESLSKQTELSIQLQTLKMNNDKLQTEIESKKDTLQDTNKELEDSLNELKKENTQLRAKYNVLDAKLKEIEEVHELNEENHHKELLMLTDKYHQLEPENEKLKVEIKRLKAELEAAKEKTVQLSEDEVASLEFENEKLQRQIKELNNKVANNKLDSDAVLVKENQQLKAKVASIQKTNQQCEEEIQELKITLQKMKAEQKDLKAKDNAQAMKEAEGELIKSKQKLGDIMNLVLELGSEELQERVFSTINPN